MTTDIITDLKIAQQVVKEALKGDNARGVSINIIGEIHIGRDRVVSGETQAYLSAPSEEQKKIQYHPSDVSTQIVPEEALEAMALVLQALPQPKLDMVLKCAVECVVRDTETMADASTELGVSYSRCHKMAKKLNLLPMSVELAEN